MILNPAILPAGRGAAAQSLPRSVPPWATTGSLRTATLKILWIVDPFFHHVKDRSQKLSCRRHPGDLFAAPLQYSKIMLTRRTLGVPNNSERGLNEQRAHHAIAFLGDMPVPLTLLILPHSLLQPR